MEDETFESYRWFLKTLQQRVYDQHDTLPKVFMSDRDAALLKAGDEVFPDAYKMLCTWHILEQNIKTSCKKLFDLSTDWETFKASVTTLKHTSNVDEIPKQLDSDRRAADKAIDPTLAMDYINGLMKIAEKRILAYTSQFCHLGISTTGRVEASHSSFKRVIINASDLQTIFNKIDFRMRQQHLKCSRRIGLNKNSGRSIYNQGSKIFQPHRQSHEMGDRSHQKL